MKDYLFNSTLKIFLYIILCAGIIIPYKVYALDLSIGATMWYAQMDQEYTKNIDPSRSFKTENGGQFFFMGPALGVKFNDDFSLTFIYLYGATTITEIETIYPYQNDCHFKRHDADFALSYSLNNYFRVFTGIKYINYSIDCGKPESSAGNIIKRDHSGFGPGLGLSAIFPIFENLFLLANLSGFCLLINKESAKYYDPGSNPASLRPKSNDYGINSGLALAYHIAPVSTTINLGGRFQYIRTVYSGDRDLNAGLYYNHNASMFYGVTLAATYFFKKL